MEGSGYAGTRLLELGGYYGNAVRHGGFQVPHALVNAAAEVHIGQDGGDPQHQAARGRNQGFRHAARHVDALLAAGEITVGDLKKGLHHPDYGSQQAQHGSQGADVRQPGNLAAQEARLAAAFRGGYFPHLLKLGGRIAQHETGHRQHYARVAGVPILAKDGKARIIPLADEGFRLLHQLGGQNGGGAGGKTAHDQHHHPGDG